MEMTEVIKALKNEFTTIRKRTAHCGKGIEWTVTTTPRWGKKKTMKIASDVDIFCGDSSFHTCGLNTAVLHVVGLDHNDYKIEKLNEEKIKFFIKELKKTINLETRIAETIG